MVATTRHTTPGDGATYQGWPRRDIPPRATAPRTKDGHKAHANGLFSFGGCAGRAKLRPERPEPAGAPGAGTAASTSPSPARPERTDTRAAAAGILNLQSAGGAGDTRARKRLAVEEEKDRHD
jgi:hypothetical protein